MDKPRHRNPSNDEANLGQKEAEREKDRMNPDEQSQDANLGQKEAGREKAEFSQETDFGEDEEE